jgi:hypothetical protein
MGHQGGCHCGAVRYEVSGEPQHVSFCHCTDCRKSAGAPMVTWAAYPEAGFQLLSGDVTRYVSTGGAVRHFCSRCGSGIYYINAQVLPGLVDIQVATLDAPEALEPNCHVQVAERIGWMAEAHSLPEFQRYPGM